MMSKYMQKLFEENLNDIQNRLKTKDLNKDQNIEDASEKSEREKDKDSKNKKG